ncbi:hypothetical protein IV73_GL001104 [Weissella kandleri]|uniref:Uncharacterized protein n=1 Tax=Weissella kandleri TaxID=1616 RepID=A0A0R2JC21_9LACO|nr:hypothetical protein [Weissella kandleri]KRN74827.1 hypothetical protein IV73_GL001104 [Weissella kandleri]
MQTFLIYPYYTRQNQRTFAIVNQNQQIKYWVTRYQTSGNCRINDDQAQTIASIYATDHYLWPNFKIQTQQQTVRGYNLSPSNQPFYLIWRFGWWIRLKPQTQTYHFYRGFQLIASAQPNAKGILQVTIHQSAPLPTIFMLIIFLDHVQKIEILSPDRKWQPQIQTTTTPHP